MKPVRLALIGASGLVGRTTLKVLEEWNVPLKSLRLFASDESIGRTMAYEGREIALEPLAGIPENVDVAIFATSSELSRKWIPAFRDAEITVIDHSTEFRMHKDVPLIIPEVNEEALEGRKGIISNPNCTASIIVIPLHAIDKTCGLKTVIADTYQSVTGSGYEALAELEDQLVDPTLPPRVYPRMIAHNVIPQIGSFDENGCSGEESKISQELRKILEKPYLCVFTTTVRVPVRTGHSAAITVECEKEVSRGKIEAAFREMRGIIYDAFSYQTPCETAGRQEVFVSRLRINEENPNWLQFWVTGDNLRKGAASNAVQILMLLFRD